WMPVESRREISKRGARVLNNETGDARILVLALSNNHRCALVDGLTDELMSVGLFTRQCHEHGVPLHSPRVIRDVFHLAIKWADDLANWSRVEKGLELHESLIRPPQDGFAAANWGKAFNGAMHWSRRLVPPTHSCELALPAAVFPRAAGESLCESPHAAQDPNSGRLFPPDAKTPPLRNARRNSTPVCSYVRHRAPLDRQIRDGQRADSRRKKRHTFRVHIRLADQPSARFPFFQQW